MKSYQDLLQAKQELKNEISDQETEIRNNKFVRFSSAVANPGELKNTVLDTVNTLKLKDILTSPIGNIVSSYLLSNKVLRKYFIGYTILRQTIPYGLNKLKDMLNDMDIDNNIEKKSS